MFQSYDIEARQSKVRKDKRIISLAPMEGKKTLSSTGMIDPRLFTGENQVIAQYDANAGMWSARYSVGATPMGLQQRFTLFNDLVEYLTCITNLGT
jgi:hypothetical protein